MMKWIKPSGIEIETNDKEETIEYCKSLGWKEKNESVDSKPEKPIVDPGKKAPPKRKY